MRPPGRARLARVRVYLGSDHAGFELKSVLANWLTSAGRHGGRPGEHRHRDRRLG
jgi:ribose 5-phosphate isomerase RpiB